MGHCNQLLLEVPGDVIYANSMQITNLGGESEPDQGILQCVVYTFQVVFRGGPGPCEISEK